MVAKTRFKESLDLFEKYKKQIEEKKKTDLSLKSFYEYVETLQKIITDCTQKNLKQNKEKPLWKVSEEDAKNTLKNLIAKAKELKTTITSDVPQQNKLDELIKNVAEIATNNINSVYSSPVAALGNIIAAQGSEDQFEGNTLQAFLSEILIKQQSSLSDLIIEELSVPVIEEISVNNEISNGNTQVNDNPSEITTTSTKQDPQNLNVSLDQLVPEITAEPASINQEIATTEPISSEHPITATSKLIQTQEIAVGTDSVQYSDQAIQTDEDNNFLTACFLTATDKLSKKIVDQEKEIHDAKIENKSLQMGNKRLQEAQKNLETKNQALTSEKNNLLTEIENLKTQLKEQTERNFSLENERGKLEQNNAILEMENQKLREQNAVLKDSNEKLQNENQTLTNTNKNLQEKLRALFTLTSSWSLSEEQKNNIETKICRSLKFNSYEDNDALLAACCLIYFIGISFITIRLLEECARCVLIKIKKDHNISQKDLEDFYKSEENTSEAQLMWQVINTLGAYYLNLLLLNNQQEEIQTLYKNTSHSIMYENNGNLSVKNVNPSVRYDASGNKIEIETASDPNLENQGSVSPLQNNSRKNNRNSNQELTPHTKTLLQLVLGSIWQAMLFVFHSQARAKGLSLNSDLRLDNKIS